MTKNNLCEFGGGGLAASLDFPQLSHQLIK